tara:strand:+ start:1222 stop:1485 length:264 start_codon:yes stop_codon:yes gene_type:complete
MKRKSKRIYESFITINEEDLITTECSGCDGEGVGFIDNTHARGGEMIPQLCSTCEGNGIIAGTVEYDCDGNQYIKKIAANAKVLGTL